VLPVDSLLMGGIGIQLLPHGFGLMPSREEKVVVVRPKAVAGCAHKRLTR